LILKGVLCEQENKKASNSGLQVVTDLGWQIGIAGKYSANVNST